jgi:Histidine phosphatase superfamily (branch 1)
MRVFLRLMLSLSLLLGLVSCGFITPPIISQPGTTTTIIMVRHAERDPGLDPPLNAEGLIRAQKLAEVLGQNGVTAIYATDYERNRQTAAPLATKLGLTVGLIAVTELTNTQALAANLGTEFLGKHAGGVVLLVGNVGSPTFGTKGILEDMYRLFGGVGDAPNRYQDMTIIVVPEAGKGAPRIIRTTYGSPSSLN